MEFFLSIRDDPKSGRPDMFIASVQVMIRVYARGLMGAG
jgi:hypothetical protein